MLTQKELKQVLHYFPNTGEFIWLINSINSNNLGKIAGTPGIHSYFIKINKKQYNAHRLAWLYMTGKWPKNQIDHIDHNPNNNTWTNLREVTILGNARNQSKAKNNTSGITGVSWNTSRKKFVATIRIKNTVLYLGSFIEKWDAVCARMKANFNHNFHPNHGK